MQPDQGSSATASDAVTAPAQRRRTLRAAASFIMPLVTATAVTTSNQQTLSASDNQVGSVSDHLLQPKSSNLSAMRRGSQHFPPSQPSLESIPSSNAGHASPPPPSSAKRASIVFPSLELAQRSASLRRTASIMHTLSRKSSIVASQSMESANDSTSQVNASWTRAASLLSRRRSSGGASAIAAESSLLFAANGSAANKQSASFKTVATAVMMLMRIQLAVQRKRATRSAMMLSQPSAHPAGHQSHLTASGHPTRPTRSGSSDSKAAAASSTQLQQATSKSAPPDMSLLDTNLSFASFAREALKFEKRGSNGAGGTTSAADGNSFAGSFDGSVLSAKDNNAVPGCAPDGDRVADGDGEGSEDGDRILEDEISVKSFDSNDIIESDPDDEELPLPTSASTRKGIQQYPSKTPLNKVINKRHRTHHFPDPDDIAQMPEAVQKHIQHRAIVVLRRFWVCVRFQRYWKARRASRQPLTPSSLPQGVLELSDVLRGWTTSMLETAFQGGFITTFQGGNYVAYPGQPQRCIVILVSGTLIEVCRKPRPQVTVAAPMAAVSNSPSKQQGRSTAYHYSKHSHMNSWKRCKPLNNTSSTASCTVLAQHTTPVVLWDRVALVEEPRTDNIGDLGLFAATNCTVAIVDIAAVEAAFKALPLQDATRTNLSARYRHIREARTAAYLQAIHVELSEKIQRAAANATAAVAAVAFSGAAGGSLTTAPVANHGSSSSLLQNVEKGSNSAATASSVAPKGVASILRLNLQSSSLLKHLTPEQEKIIVPKLQPLSFLEGEDVLPKDADDFRNVYFVLRGRMIAVSRYRDENAGGNSAQWKDLVFSTWNAGESVGDKAMYFQEPHVFTLRAVTHCDLAVLRRSVLLQLMESSDRFGLKQAIASGAFVVRANDPVVRLRLQSVRSIPAITAALQEGLLSEAVVRQLHERFTIRVFPKNELMCSASETVKCVLVLSTGVATVDPTGPAPSRLPIGTPIGCAMLCGMRWRYSIFAHSECVGWALPLPDLVDMCKKFGVLKRIKELSASQYQLALHTDGTNLHLYESHTPQQVVDSTLAAKGDAAAQSRLSSLLVMPTRRLLDQKSFQHKLPADIPVVPPPPVPSVAALMAAANSKSSNGNRTARKEKSATPCALSIQPLDAASLAAAGRPLTVPVIEIDPTVSARASPRRDGSRSARYAPLSSRSCQQAPLSSRSAARASPGAQPLMIPPSSSSGNSSRGDPLTLQVSGGIMSSFDSAGTRTPRQHHGVSAMGSPLSSHDHSFGLTPQATPRNTFLLGHSMESFSTNACSTTNSRAVTPTAASTASSSRTGSPQEIYSKLVEPLDAAALQLAVGMPPPADRLATIARGHRHLTLLRFMHQLSCDAAADVIPLSSVASCSPLRLMSPCQQVTAAEEAATLYPSGSYAMKMHSPPCIQGSPSRALAKHKSTREAQAMRSSSFAPSAFYRSKIRYQQQPSRHEHADYHALAGCSGDGSSDSFSMPHDDVTEQQDGLAKRPASQLTRRSRPIGTKAWSLESPVTLRSLKLTASTELPPGKPLSSSTSQRTHSAPFNAGSRSASAMT